MDQSPCLSNSQEEGFPDYTNDIVHGYVSRDALGPLRSTSIVPVPRDESFAIEDHSISLSDVSHDVFLALTMKKHAQIACSLLQQITDLGSPFFDHVPDDIE